MKRLWTDGEIIAVPATVDLLRRMRSAAVTEKPSVYLRSRGAINNFWGGHERIHSPQEALAHAEELADAAGDFFAAKLSKTTHRKTEFEKWQDLLSDVKRQYQLYGEMTYARTSVGEVVGNLIIARLRSLHIDPDYTVHWDLFKNNHLGANSIEELVRKDLGIISPLSGDYLMARVYRSYLQRTRIKSFPVHAAALSRDLSVLVLPTTADGHLPFGDKSAIGIYLDTTETGNTARALFEHLQTTYPLKTVHEPKMERTEFTQSKKIRKYWARRE